MKRSQEFIHLLYAFEWYIAAPYSNFIYDVYNY